jgi:lactate dehydrogenase-like 2-hydroxyacid dehydrogenase
MMGVFSGERVLRRKRGERAEALDWIVTLAIISVATFLAVLLARGDVTRNIAVVRALSYGTLSYALYDVYRFIRPKAWPYTPRLWLYEHIVKMIGGYSGAVAAFSGSVLVLFPPPWRQLWATVSGWILAVAMVVYYARQGRRAAA